MTLRRLLPKKNDAGAAMAFLRRPRGAISCCIGTSESAAAASSGAHIRPSREAMLERMANEEFDLVIVGGGATGCGAALDAASRGLKVAMVERADFGAGTSARRWVCMKMCLFFFPFQSHVLQRIRLPACLPAMLLSRVLLPRSARALSFAVDHDELYSTKLLWAGSRYLVNALVKLLSPSSLLQPRAAINAFAAEFKMVLNCHRERTFLLQVRQSIGKRPALFVFVLS